MLLDPQIFKQTFSAQFQFSWFFLIFKPEASYWNSASCQLLPSSNITQPNRFFAILFFFFIFNPLPQEPVIEVSTKGSN